MILELTIKNILKVIAPLICIIILALLLMYFVFADYTEVLLISLCFGFVIFILPTLYVFINYYNEDKRKKVSITKTQIKVVINDNVYEINKSEIDYILISGRRDVLTGSNHRYTLFDDFYYLKIVDKSASKLILTSLLSTEIKEIVSNYMSNEKIIYNYVFFPSISRRNEGL